MKKLILTLLVGGLLMTGLSAKEPEKKAIFTPAICMSDWALSSWAQFQRDLE